MASYYYPMRITVIFLSSSVVERSAVNRFVVGSNPTWGDNRFTHLVFINALFAFEKIKDVHKSLMIMDILFY